MAAALGTGGRLLPRHLGNPFELNLILKLVVGKHSCVSEQSNQRKTEVRLEGSGCTISIFSSSRPVLQLEAEPGQQSRSEAQPHLPWSYWPSEGTMAGKKGTRRAIRYARGIYSSQKSSYSVASTIIQRPFKHPNDQGHLYTFLG